MFNLHLVAVPWNSQHVITWACMVAIRTGSLVFIDDVTADRSYRMNTGMY